MEQSYEKISPVNPKAQKCVRKVMNYLAGKAVTSGTAEYDALLSDMDHMANLLKPFSDRGIPILWRPFHEMDGTWFWWGAKGPEPAKKLWKIMYERFTEVHDLTNLIWVWNAAKAEFYPGDDVVDVISRDMYPPAHEHTARIKEYQELIRIPGSPKPVLIGEIGVLPDPEAVHREKTGWSSYMTWSKDFCLTEEYTDSEMLKKVYDSSYAITKEDLPQLY